MTFDEFAVHPKFVGQNLVLFHLLQICALGFPHLLVKTMDFSQLNRGQMTLMGSAFCVVLSLHFTLQLVSQHLFYWKNPKEQKAILIIILMAPIYAVVSFVGLLDIKGSKAFFMFLESVKECYEAFVSAPFAQSLDLALALLLFIC